jgi:hypothetical protein
VIAAHDPNGCLNATFTRGTVSKLHATATAAIFFCNEFGSGRDRPTKPAIYGAADGLSTEVKKSRLTDATGGRLFYQHHDAN